MTEELSIPETGSQDLSSSHSIDVTSQEKMIPQSSVNKMAGILRQESYQKGIQDGLRKAQESSGQSPSLDSANGDMLEKMRHEVTKDVTDTIKSNLIELANQQQQEQLNQRYKQLADEFKGKLTADKDKFDNVDEVLHGFVEDSKTSPVAVDRLIYALNGLDNTADVAAYLHNNPEAYTKALSDFNHSPRAAEKALKQAASNLKANQNAKEVRYREPLSQIKSSIGGIDNGSRYSTVDDFANDPHFFG